MGQIHCEGAACLISLSLSTARRDHSSAEPPGNATFLEVQCSVA